MTKILVLLLVALSVGSCAALLRTEPFIRGSIVATGDGWVDVRHKSGRVVRVLIVPTTDVRDGTPSAVAPTLMPGRRTTITLVAPRGPFVARKVRVAGARN